MGRNGAHLPGDDVGPFAGDARELHCARIAQRTICTPSVEVPTVAVAPVVPIGAIVAIRSRRSIRRLRSAGAKSSDTARSLDELRLKRDRFFQRWEREGVVRSTPDGRWYLDATAYAAHSARHRRVATIVIG